MPSGRPTRSPCLPSELQEIACAMHVPTRWASEVIRPRPSESIRGHPTEAIRTSYTRASEGNRASYARESEGSRARVGRPECMATYVLGRACAMQHVHSLCLSKGRSPRVHGDLQGRPECMATYGQHCGFHPI
ncbi:hypothetical protein F3Y22_tig00111745pilonHSYRG00047 [Hibiscus syriacus]|uniref:Uncharacterized protein n=1 Tax=Hibiscus syriacus TaxID=106335 RepID=A0A6A2XGG5_HIBSY|nr:hypothetical protein F3Y22_tig00111745pilonHSYRG00047 [Hibiscus syriacus]